MEKKVRKSVERNLGGVFTAGLLLFLVQFGAGRLWDMLFIFTTPFAAWNAFVRDGVLVVWRGLAVLMPAPIGFCIWSRRFQWGRRILQVFLDFLWELQPVHNLCYTRP